MRTIAPCPAAWKWLARAIPPAEAGAASGLNRIIFGDLTGASNSRSEITEYRFLHGVATPAASSSRGGIKSLYRWNRG